MLPHSCDIPAGIALAGRWLLISGHLHRAATKPSLFKWLLDLAIAFSLVQSPVLLFAQTAVELVDYVDLFL